MDKDLSKLQEIVEDRGAWHAAVHRVAELDMITDWTTIHLFNSCLLNIYYVAATVSGKKNGFYSCPHVACSQVNKRELQQITMK